MKTADRVWPALLNVFRFTNVIAAIVFCVSIYRLSDKFKGLALGIENNLFSFLLPIVGAFTSLTYMFGFFGVNIVSSIFLDEQDTKEQSKPFVTSEPNISSPLKVQNHSESKNCDSRLLNGTKSHDNYDVIVVGGGIAGCAAAITLARQQRRILLIERDLSEQHGRIIGELLQPGGLRALERLGLDDCVKGKSDEMQTIESIDVFGYGIIKPDTNDRIVLKYPTHDPRTLWQYIGFVASQDIKIIFFLTYALHFVNAMITGISMWFVCNIFQNSPITLFFLLASILLAFIKLFRLILLMGSNCPNTMTKNAPQGRSFHNSRLVQNLRKIALKEPNIVVVQGMATSLIEKEDPNQISESKNIDQNTIIGVEYKRTQSISHDLTSPNDTEEELEILSAYAPLTIVCDGIGSGMRKKIDPNVSPKPISTFAGIIVHHPPMESPVPYRCCGHVILANPSPTLIYQISPTETRVLVDIYGPVPRQATGELQEYMKNFVAPQLPKELQSYFIKSVEEQQIKSMQNRSFAAAKINKSGVMMLGDALNMRHPLTGGGMTVAFRDVELFSSCISNITDLTDFSKVEQARKRFYSERRTYAGTINILADALYAVFSTPGKDESREDMRSACFDYLKSGWIFSAGPIGLLSGLTPSPAVLATHFFFVAFFSAFKFLFPFPTIKNLNRVYRILHVACIIIMPLLTRERSTFLSFYPIRKIINFLFPWESYIN